MRDKYTFVFWCGVMLIALVAVVLFGINVIRRSNKVAPFEPYLEGYIALDNPAVTGPLQPEGKIDGRMVTINLDTRQLDYAYFDLPEELQARNPDDVATVALIRWSRATVDRDRNANPFPWDRPGPEAEDVTVKVVNLAGKQLVGHATFRWDPKPERLGDIKLSDLGSRRNADLVGYLKSLPRS
jgi:hypothetical protein